MPPIQYDFNGLANALNNFTGTMTGILDRQAKEQARADLLNMQANFELESNRFMNNLRNTGSYENWEKDYNDFIQKQGDLMQKQSRNQYTAKAAQEMLLGYSVNMRRNVENQVYEMRNKDIMNSYENTAKIVMQNDGFNSEEKMNRVSDIYNREIINGKIDRQMYEAKLTNAYSNVYLDHYKNYVSEEYIFNALKDGKTLEQLYSELDKDSFELSLRAVDNANTTIEDYENGNAAFTDITNLIDKNKLKESVKDTMRKTYKLSEQQLQKDNDNYFSQEYGKLFTPGMSLIEQVRFCEIAISKLNNQYTGNLMTSDDRKKWVDAFQRYAANIEKEKAIENKDKAGSTAKIENFAAYIRGYPEQALTAIANGELLNSYEAKAAIQKEIEQIFFSREWSETDGLSLEEKKKYFAINYSNYGNTVLSNEFIRKRLEHEPKFAALNARYNEVIKDIAKNPNNYTKDAASYMSELLYDLVASTGQEVTDKQVQEFESNLNAVTLTKADKLISGFTLETRLSKVEENDVVFTDRNGQEHVAAGAKESLEKLSNDIIAKMRKDKGIELSFKGFEKIPNDATSVPHFVDKDGKEYKARTIRNEKGKAIGIELVDMDGNVIEGTKEKEKTEKQRTKQALKEAKKEVNKYELYKPESIIYGE